MMFTRFLIGTVVLGLVVGFAAPQSDRAPVAASVESDSEATAAGVSRRHTAEARVDTVINRSDDGHFYVDAEVNGQLVHFVVDTGATSVALTLADAQRVGIPVSPEHFEVVARGASGDVRGQEININRIAIDQKEVYDSHGLVLDTELDVSLLGQSFLSKVGTVLIEGDKMTLR